jgi:hypothetical protein
MLTKNSQSFTNGSFITRDIQTVQENLGYSFASRYSVNSKLLVKISFEKAYRIPQAVEVFGDGILILASPELLPEIS